MPDVPAVQSSGISSRGISPHCRTLLEKEIRLFDREYQTYFLEGETKPKRIGAPFLLHNPGSRTGILLVHGLMAAPEEVREWAQFLYSKGYSVYAPRLAGHGTSAVDLSLQHHGDWLNSVDRGTAILKTCCDRMVIGGFSTGAGLALHQAIHHPDLFEAVIAVSAPLQFKGLSANFVEKLCTWNGLVTRLGMGFLAKPYAKNHPDNPQINYHRCPIEGIVEVKALMKKVDQDLASLKIPALIMQGSQDPKVAPQSGTRIFQRITHPKAQYKEIDFHLHGIVRGTVAQGVFDEVERFLHTISF